MNASSVSVRSESTVAWIAYFLHLIGAVAGLTSIVGLILNYVRRNQYGDPLVSHHHYMIRSFWWGLLWLALGIVTTPIFIGWAICGIAWVWYVYRHVRGMIALANDEPMY
jgi:uncharacterized membrane protein